MMCYKLFDDYILILLKKPMKADRGRYKFVQITEIMFG